METRFVPDTPASWLVYDLGALVLALPSEFRAAADAVAAMPRQDVQGVIAALTASGIAAAAPFAVLESVSDGSAPGAAGGLRIALRGPATVSAGAETLTGLGAEPWLERLVPGVAVARLTVPGGEWTFSLATASAASASAASVAAPATSPVAVQSVGAGLFSDAAPPDDGEAGYVTEIPDFEISAPPDPLPPLPVPPGPVPPAPVPPAPVPPAPVPAVDEAVDEGRTVLVSELARRDLPGIPGAVPPVAVPPAASLPVASPPVGSPSGVPADDKTVVVDEIARIRARRTAAGLVPTQLPPAPAAASAPALSLELPDGSREPLDAVVMVGRAPSASADGTPSRLLRLDGDGDISRNHARVAVEGGVVVVTDLGSRNGTVVRIPGRSPQKLRGGEPTPVLVGTVIDFGGGIELAVREG